MISPQNTLCLFCHPRGGSTWLAEFLQQIPGSVLIDEPLWRGNETVPFEMPHPQKRKVKQVADLSFYYYQHIPETTSWPEAADMINDILCGRTPAVGLYNEQDLTNLKEGHYYITKFCYANLLMPWLTSQFQLPSILFTRHPCAVIASQLKHPSWSGLQVTGQEEVGDFAYHHIYKEAFRQLGLIRSREAYLAFVWALGFKQTAMHPANNRRWLTLSYEGLLLNPTWELDRISERFQLDLRGREKDLLKPSKSSIYKQAGTRSKLEQLTWWKSQLSKEQVRQILDVLTKFEIEIYSENAEPDYDGLYIEKVS